MHFDDILRFFIKKILSLNSVFDGALILQFKLYWNAPFFISECIIKWRFFFINFLNKYKMLYTPPVDFSEYKVANFGADYL